jgi:hypothetical protein
MIISRGREIKQVTLYPLARSITELEQMLWIEEIDFEEETIYSFCSISQATNFREVNDENILNHFIYNPYFKEQFEYSQQISTNDLLEQSFEENCIVDSLRYLFETIFPVNTILNSHNKVIGISPGKCLNINSNLENYHEERLIQLLQK